MAPSPELGQPKAPDKTTQSAATGANSVQSENVFNNNANSDSSLNNDVKMNSFDENSDSTKNVKDLVPAVAAATSAPAANATHVSATHSNSLDSTNLKNWDDCNFKSLLDEAYRYRSPKDRENKSEIFLQLLQKAERKEEESEYLLRSHSSRYTQGSNRHKHGGSLQDLDKTSHNEVSLEICGNRCHQHYHNSRPKKYSSVSSRQREGGSLPSNVNVSNCYLSICEQPFLNEETTKRRGKSERTCSGTSCASGTSGTSSTVSTGHDSLSTGQIKDETYTNSSGDTIIDMNDSFADDTQHLLAHDSLAQGIAEPLDCDEGTELPTLKKIAARSTMGSSTSGKFECPHADAKHFVDDSVTFPSLERGKNVEPTYLHLDESYKACKSILGGKSDIEKPSTTIFSNTRSSTKHCDENGNSLNSPYNSSQSQSKTKKKKLQSERNTKTLNVQAFAGYRGEDSVEELLKFIENTDSKKNEKSLNANKKKDKKKDKEKEKDINKKEIHKVKKSNSLEELRSCTKLDEDEKPENQVTLRNKGKKSTVISSSLSDGKENLKQQNNKRGERRSWGTEELTYLGENNAIEEVREKAKEKEKKKSRDIPERHEKLDSVKKKKDDATLNSMPSVLADSIHSESAEFHVVTKKKKTKKRQQTDETRPGIIKSVSIKDSPNGSCTSTILGQSQRKFQASSNFTNDREVYLNSFTANEARRKSTSSVPPSEKSDSSDLDSVHSLPVESTSNRHHSSGNLVVNQAAAAATVAAAATMTAAVATGISLASYQPQSYADIARTVNTGKFYSSVTSPPIDKMDKWPSVSSYSMPSSSGGSGGNVSNSTTYAFSGSISETQIETSKNYKKSLNKDFPYLVSDKGNHSNNDAGSTCSSTSSNSTVVKQISYSQSLNDDKSSSSFISGVRSPTAAISGTRLTDVIKLNEVSRQTLQKSKSVESDNYYSNMDQYPALEKTVKRHTNPGQLHEMKFSNMLPNAVPAAAPTSASKSQQRSPLTVMNMSPATMEAIGAPLQLNSIDNGSFLPNVAVCTATPSASCNPNGKKIKQQQQQQQQHANVKYTYSDSSHVVALSSIVETNNAKNRQQQQQQQQSQQSITALDQFCINSGISSKKVKTDAILLQQIPVVTTNPHGRKSKKDKNSNPKGAASSSDVIFATTPMHTAIASHTSNANKLSNRPAVIILNDTNDSSLSTANDFTFGDFNEEELRLFDNNQHLDDSSHFSLSQSGQDSVDTVLAENASLPPDEAIHLSPHSDQGYSSSNNRSILSESTDSSLLCNRIELDQSTPIVADSSATSCCDNNRKPLNVMAALLESSQPLAPPSPATNLGTNYIVASAKVDLSCISNNSLSKHSELSYDPCIIAVNSVDINRNKSTVIYSSDNSVQQQHKTQQLVNQILVNSSSGVSNSNNNGNNNNINISNATSGMSSNNNNNDNNSNSSSVLLSSSSSSLDSKMCANSVLSSNDVGSGTIAATTATNPSESEVNRTHVDNSTQLAAITPASTTTTATTATVATNFDENDVSYASSHKKFNKKEINIRFVAPPPSMELNSVNFEKIVDFVGLAWEEILHGVNRGTQFYNGQ